jgi:hypothetical protein
LEIESTSKGLLLPRLTDAQMNAMLTPPAGMLVFNTTNNCTYIYKATLGWYSLCSGDTVDSTTASNGLTLVGKDVRLGGTLNAATGIALNGNNLSVTGNGNVNLGTTTTNNRVVISSTSNPLELRGLQGGSATDSIMSVDAATGIVKYRTLADVLTNQNLVWKLDGNAVTAIRTLGTTTNFDLPFITNNIERARITTSGNFGIGTTAPTNKLEVVAAADPLKLGGLQSGATTDSVMTVNAAGVAKQRSVDGLINGSNAAWKTLGNTGTNASTNFVGTTDAVDFVTRTNNTERTRVTSAGNFGIGTTTPSQKLEVAGNALIKNTTGAAAALINDGTTTGQVNVTAGATTLSSDGTNGLNVTAIAAAPVSISTTNAVRMTVAAGGNVGVGTTTPNSILQLAGAFSVPISTKTGNYTVTAADHTIIGDCSASGFTFTLPSAASCAGRTYVIIKGDSGANALTFSPALSLSTTATMGSVNYNVRMMIQSDGTNWWLLSRY